MSKLWKAVGAISASAMLLTAANPAAAYYRHHHYYHHYRTGYDRSYDRSYSGRDCYAEHHASANTGTVLGAGGGAVIGHQIGAHAHRC